MNEESWMSVADIIQIVIGALSMIATVAVSFVIYWLQSRHEKELERISKQKEDELLSEEAESFLIDNEAERDFLPLCIFATNLHRHEKHTRAIYTNFCRCRVELQNEILKKAEFRCRTILGTEWIDNAIEKLKEDMKKYELGSEKVKAKDFYLYDGAKYFHRAFDRYRENVWEYSHLQCFNQIVPYRNLSTLTGSNLIPIGNYIDDYIYFYVEKHECKDAAKNPIPPIDYVWESQKLGIADESVVCGWLMEVMYQVALTVHSRLFERDSDVFYEDETDEQPETFEDMYYQTAQILYYTYRVEHIR